MSDITIPPDADRESRQLFKALGALEELEVKIGQCRTVDEVEEIRVHTMAIQTYARERCKTDSGCADLVNQMVNRAKRIAVLCMVQIRKIQDTVGIGGKLKLEKADNSTVELSRTQLAKQRHTIRQLASIPAEELHKRFDEQEAKNGKIQPAKLAEEIRQERKARGKEKVFKTPPEVRQKRRDRYYQQKVKEKGVPVAAVDGESALAQKFTRYWIEEEKRLSLFFSVGDLEQLEAMWKGAFEQFRKEAVTEQLERANARAALKKDRLKRKEAMQANNPY